MTLEASRRHLNIILWFVLSVCHVQIVLLFVFIRAGRRARVYLRSASRGSVESFSVSGSGGSLSLRAGVWHVGAGGKDGLALETSVSRPLGSR